jgi:phosphate transport system ATP-binding protein
MVDPKIQIDKVSYAYGDNWVLRNVTLDIVPKSVTVFFGPAGGGKTSLLRLINRLNDLVEGTQMTGQILLDGQDVYGSDTYIPNLRRRVGMVFALPLPLPGTIRENVLYGPKLAGIRNQSRLDEILERSLTQAALWEEVKDRIDHPAISLSGGQQAARVADQTAFFLMGDLVEYAPGKEIFTQPGDKRTEDYVTGRLG